MKQVQGTSRQPVRLNVKHDETINVQIRQVNTSHDQEDNYQSKHRAAIDQLINSHRKANFMTKSGQDEVNRLEAPQIQQQLQNLLRKSPLKDKDEQVKQEEPKVEKKEKLAPKGNYFVQPKIKEDRTKIQQLKNPNQFDLSPKSGKKRNLNPKTPSNKQDTINYTQPSEKESKLTFDHIDTVITIQYKEETSPQIKQTMDQDKASVIIQKNYRRYKVKKTYKEKITKINRYRYNVVAELVKTEQNYVKDLLVIMNFLMDPIKKNKIIAAKEYQTLFSNLREIIQLNEAFLNSLNKKFEQFDDKTCIGKVAIDYGPFFKLYFSYANEFKGVQAVCEQLKKANQKFSDFLKNQEKLPEFRGMNFEDFMIKPIQRLPKYVLFMQDLVKHTLKTHPDYNDLKKALNLFLQVNHSNNENMNRILSGPKLFELSRLYQNELSGVQLVNGKRMYKGESIRRIQWENKDLQVVVYYLSDILLLINERIGYKPILVLAIILNEVSVCNDLPNTQFYKNLLQLVGSNSSVTFMEDSEQSKKEHIELLDKLIKDIKESSESRTEALKSRIGSDFQKNKFTVQSIQVEVLGTEERAHGTIYYIVQVLIEEIKQKLFLRFKDCVELREQAKKQFPNLKLQTLNLGMFASETSDLKSQETASIQVQTFLAGLLNSIEFQQQPDKILHQIGLPQNFLDLPKIFKEQINSDCAENLTNLRLTYRKSSNLMSSQIQTSQFLSFTSTSGRESLGLFNKKQSRGFSAAKLLHSQNYLNQAKQHSVEPAAQMKNGGLGLFSTSSKQNLQTLQITVITHHNSYTQIALDVGIKACALDLYKTLEKQLSINDSWDFRFMVADAAHQELRALADEEILINVLEDRGSILKKMISQSEKKLFFKKYIYFDQTRELLDYQKDPCKMHLVYNQTVNEVKCGDYAFSFKEYLALTAVYMHSQAQQISDLTIKQVLPEYAVKFTSLANWKQGIQYYMKQIDTMVKDQGSYLSVELVRNIFIALVQKKELYGAQLFVGEEISDNKKQSDQAVLIGVKHSLVMVLKKNREIIRIIPYIHIQQIKGLAGSLVLVCNEKEIKFRTPHGYQIQTLIEEYQELADTLDDSNDEQRKKVYDIIQLANSISKLKVNTNKDGQ